MEPQALAARLGDRAFTPGKRELGAVFDLLASEDEQLSELAAKALVRARDTAIPPALERLSGAPERARRRLVRLMSRLAAELPDARLRSALLACLEDTDPQTRRLAMVGLGKLPAPEVEQALLAALAHASGAERRALVAALGKIGSERALGALEALGAGDSELERVRTRALLVLERSLGRTPARIELDRPLAHTERVVAGCRSGLAALLAEELAPWSARARSTRAVELEFGGPLRELLVARTALELGLEYALPAGSGLEEALARALTSDRVAAALRSWTLGRPTFRIAFTAGGHRRATVFRIAELVRRRSDAIVNDPRGAAWEVRVDERSGTFLLLPRFEDPRFSYRRADVPAASHPTIAAALARAAGVRAHDVVWDPFCGSGLELIERGLLGPYQRLIGSDLASAALAAADQNLRASGLGHWTLARADARDHSPPAVTLILTNPPMGRRVARGQARALLLEFLEHARGVLKPSGRIVWLSPLARADARRVRALGWSVQRGPELDLGGFSAELQTLYRA